MWGRGPLSHAGFAASSAGWQLIKGQDTGGLLALKSLTSSQLSLPLRGSGKLLAGACGWSDQYVAPARTIRFLPP